MSAKSEESRADRAAFRAQLARRRRYYLRMGIPLVVLVLAGGSFVVVRQRSVWALIPGLACPLSMLALVVMAFAVPSLRCPRCSGKLDKAIDQYCPECGSQSLVLHHWPRAPRCEACGTTFSKELGRMRGSWTIEYCTHCGALLNEMGASAPSSADRERS